MEEILEIIKEKANLCEKEQKMFVLPIEAELYIVKHEEIQPSGSILIGDFWRLEKDDEWLEVKYISKDKCRTFQINPDRSCLTINGVISKKIFYSNAWDEN